MRFTLPQFVEHEAKIIWVFTWRQFIFIGSAGIIGFILYFTIPFQYFILITIVLMLGALALAFLKIGGKPLPTILVNLFKFTISSQTYLWGKKEVPMKLLKREVVKEEKVEEVEKGPLLKISEKSQLKKLASQVETRTR